jgi:hypothetical protein
VEGKSHASASRLRKLPKLSENEVAGNQLTDVGGGGERSLEGDSESVDV